MSAELPTVAQVKSTRDLFTPEQQFAARELQTILAPRAVLTFVSTKLRWRDGREITGRTVFVLAVDRGAIVNVSYYVRMLTKLKQDPYCRFPALKLGSRSPQDVARELSTLLYLDEDKVKAEVIS